MGLYVGKMDIVAKKAPLKLMAYFPQSDSPNSASQSDAFAPSPSLHCTPVDQLAIAIFSPPLLLRLLHSLLPVFNLKSCASESS